MLTPATPSLVTASGLAKSTPGLVVSLSFIDIGVAGLGYANIRDGGAGGTIKWRIGSSGQFVSSNIPFGEFPLRFDTNIYVELVGGVTPAVSIAVL